MSFRSLGESSVRYIPAPSLRCSRSIIFAVKSETRIAVSFGHRRSQVRHDDRRAGDSSGRSEEHTSELQSLMRISYAVFCWKKKKTMYHIHIEDDNIIDEKNTTT